MGKNIIIYFEGGIKTEIYHNNGILHEERWTDKEGELHRENGPSRVYYNSDGGIISEYWHINGKSHRVDGPSYTSYTEDGILFEEIWRINDSFHREDGPAVICDRSIRPRALWYINGNNITEEVKDWIVKKKLPSWKEWTNKEKALFKLMFVK